MVRARSNVVFTSPCACFNGLPIMPHTSAAMASASSADGMRILSDTHSIAIGFGTADSVMWYEGVRVNAQST